MLRYSGDMVYCDDPSHPAYPPARHRDTRGRLRPPVGTLREMLRRGMYGDDPEAWQTETRRRLVATLLADDDLRATLRRLIGGDA